MDAPATPDIVFEIADQPLAGAPDHAARQRPDSGAVVTFEGTARNHNEGRAVLRLEYEAHKALAEAEGRRVLGEVLARHAGCRAAHCVHRTGILLPGEVAVRVTVWADHRKEAFAACSQIMDELKARVPIWKKEHYADATEARWLEK